MSTSALIYRPQGNPRTVGILAVAKENNIDLELVETVPATGVPTDYLKINKLGRVPTFVGADGFILSECLAIAVYSEFFLECHALAHATMICYTKIQFIPGRTHNVDYIHTLSYFSSMIPHELSESTNSH